MKSILPLLLTSFLTIQGFGQCINGFKKLYPEVTTDYSLDFGKSVSMHDNFLAVGAPDSDTIGRQSGIVYIYQKGSGATWTKIASMTASSVFPDLRLGVNVRLSENYLLVSAEGRGGKVFIYKKPATGWHSATELAVLSYGGSEAFGTAYSHPVDISDDENTIVIADAMRRHNFSPTTIAGTLYIYHKDVNAEWSNTIVPVQIKATTDIIDFGRAGVYVSGTRVITGTPFTPSGHGNAFIYNDPSGTFSNLTLEATLSASGNDSFWMDNLVVLEDGIMWSVSGDGLQVVFFQKPSNGNWSNAQPTYKIDPDGEANSKNAYFIHLATNGTDLYTASVNSQLIANITVLKKGTNGWTDPSLEKIDSNAASYYGNKLGTVFASNEDTNIVTGFVEHPLNPGVLNSLRVYSKAASNTWQHSMLFSVDKSTRNHGYGTRMIVQDENMFVSAPRDNTIKADAGKVYIYKKNGLQWDKVFSIKPVIGTYSDSDFGSALAANDNFLVVGATNWLPKGRFFVYKKIGSTWNNPALVQEIEIPDAQNTVIAYGDNVAMDNKWLLIPYGNYAGSPDTMVAIYEFNGNIWSYKESVSTSFFNIFSKSTTLGIAIDGNTFVAGSKVFELNAGGHWVKTAELSPTDPEYLRFIYPTFELASNGSDFGQVVSIKGNTIFIGAPRKDSAPQVIWDVGAVYVYNKLPGESWTNRTESVKLVPNSNQRSGLFGSSIHVLGTSILVGAPVAKIFANGDLNGNETNDVPGKAMLFQTSDGLWESAFLSKTFVGETGVRDEFGGQVQMDEQNIYISAPLEDITTGRLSGSVYITDAPPVITPVPGLCSTANVITLSAKPLGGTWSGPGITDAVRGIFDPLVAGPGKHLVNYTLPGCMLTGNMQIRIDPKPSPVLGSGKDHLVCEEAYPSVPLSVSSETTSSYQWFFRQHENEAFTLTNNTAPEIIATQRGQYQVRAYNADCETFSEIMSVKNETVDVVVDLLVKVCGTPPGGLQLNATPTGGTWEGTGIANNLFSMNGVSNGDYVLTYQYNSPLGCNYQGNTVMKVERLTAPIINRNGNLCAEGVVDLSLAGGAVPDATYTWSWKASNDLTYTEEGSGTVLQTDVWGSYILSVKKDFCEAVSAPLTIADYLLMHLTPDATESEVCYENDFHFTFPADAEAVYSWSYSKDGQILELMTETSNSIHPVKTGYYVGAVKKGICTFTGSPRYIYIHSKDSVFVPNIFTPNGDDKNEYFQIQVLNRDTDDSDADLQDDITFDIFNRYGKKVFSSPDNHPWSGVDFPAGVYFWSGAYHTCGGKQRIIKGWVQLMK